MNRFVPMLTIVVALVLQVGVAPHIVVAEVQPNLLLLASVTIGMVKGARVGMTSGFTAGLLSDLIGTAPIGAAALVFCLVGFVAGSVKDNMFADGWVVPILVAFVAGLSAEVGYMTLLGVVGESGLTVGGVTSRASASALYTCAVALITYPWVARFLRWERPMTMFRRVA